MPTRTRFVFLMHPKEARHTKAGTGRLTHLCLPNSEIQVGMAFDEHAAVQALLNDPNHLPLLVYPGEDALNLSVAGWNEAALGGRRPVLVLLDATWSQARKMLKSSPSLQRLPRVMFTPSAPSRYRIKQQPIAGCLSTLETTHELLLALARAGLETYAQPTQLLDLFDRMQAHQMACAADPTRGGYRRQPYGEPGERVPLQGRSLTRRRAFFRVPEQTLPPGDKTAGSC